MKIITRSLWGSALQTSLLLELPYQPTSKTTLNEKFSIQSNQTLEDDKLPHVKYFCIGNGGHKHVTGADGTPYTSPINHRASDAALYKHMPFILRPVNEDLSIVERANYGLRRVETHNGINYVAYYLKRMDLSAVVAELQSTTVIDGVTTTVPYVPTSDNLNPTPPAMTSTDVITTDGDYLSTSAIIPMLFTEEDVANLVEVAEIMDENPYMAVVSEIGLCSGVDRVVTGAGPGSSQINYNEVVGCQIATFITTHYAMSFSNKGFDLQIELGATEPLLTE